MLAANAFESALANFNLDCVRPTAIVGLEKYAVEDGEATSAGAFLSLRTRFAAPFDQVLIHCDESFQKNYPHGDVAFILNDSKMSVHDNNSNNKGERQFHSMPSDAQPTFSKIAATIERLARATISGGARDASGPKSIAELFPLCGEEDSAMDADARAFSSAETPAFGGGQQRAASYSSYYHRPHRLSSGSAEWFAAPTGGGEGSAELHSAVRDAVAANRKLHDDLARVESATLAATGNKFKTTAEVHASAGVVGGASATVTMAVPLQLLEEWLCRDGHISVHVRSESFKHMFELYGLSLQEQILISVTDVDVANYPKSGNGGSGSNTSVSVSVGQPSHFVGAAPPPPTMLQLQRIMENWLNYAMRVVDMSGNNNNNNNNANGAAFEKKLLDTMGSHGISEAAAQDLLTDPKKQPQPQQKPKKQLPGPLGDGIFVGLLKVLVSRMCTLQNFCVICDRDNPYAAPAAQNVSNSSGPAGATICNDPLCIWKFQTLDVCSFASRASATQVLDLLVVAFKEAVTGPRPEKVVQPFPHVLDPATRSVALGAKDKDMQTLKAIMTNFPLIHEVVVAGGNNSKNNKKQQQQPRALHTHHRLAPSIVSWLFTAIPSTIIKAEPRCCVPWMNTKHQFRIIEQSPEHNERFQRLKQQHPSLLMWHGAPRDCIFSILANGLKNMSKTPMQLHGNAAGGRGGIYSAQNAGTSAGYSGLYPNANSFNNNQQQGDFIDPGAQAHFGGLFLCEVIVHDLTQGDINSSYVLVQPNDSHVVLRALFVYTDGLCPGEVPYGSSSSAQAGKIGLNDIDLKTPRILEPLQKFVNGEPQ